MAHPIEIGVGRIGPVLPIVLVTTLAAAPALRVFCAGVCVPTSPVVAQDSPVAAPMPMSASLAPDDDSGGADTHARHDSRSCHDGRSPWPEGAPPTSAPEGCRHDEQGISTHLRALPGPESVGRTAKSSEIARATRSEFSVLDMPLVFLPQSLAARPPSDDGRFLSPLRL